MSIIALLTDFGTRDHYVACMKGVILQINPKVTIVDISHEVGSQDLVHAAFALRQSLPYFPADTIFVAVVDPGVGSSRRILGARYSGRVVLAPDNGVLTMVHRDAELQELRVVENRRLFASQISSTFHGRDIFAPVAAHLSRGIPFDQLGPQAHRIEVLNMAKPTHQKDGSIDGQVMYVDNFGNLITNISDVDISAVRSPRRGGPHLISLGDLEIGPIHVTYSDVPAGEPLALMGSGQMLEIGVNGGNAAQQLGAVAGTVVRVR